MTARLGIVSLLLGATLLSALDTRMDMGRFTPRLLLTLTASTFAMSLLSALWLRWRRDNADPKQIAAWQLGWDLLVITVLVYVSGGPASVFSFLYGVTVLSAAILLGPRACLVSAAAASLLYAGLCAALAFGVLSVPPDQYRAIYQLTFPELSFAVFSNVFGIALVAWLAAHLATRLHAAGGELLRAEQNAASLARLHDDIIRSLTAGLMTTGLDGTIRTVNPAASSMFHCDTSQLIGRSVYDLLPLSTEVDGTSSNTMGSRGEGTVGSRREGDARRPDSTSFPVGTTETSLRDVHGAQIGLLITFQDLTEIAELRRTTARAERMAALGNLSAGLAHEIRNPLSSISGAVELVRDSNKLGEEDCRLLGIVLSEVDRLNDLVTTMLQVGRPRDPQRQTHDFGALASEVIDMARRGLAMNAGVTIELDVTEPPVTAHIDAAQMRQVLWNLIKNAVQASDRGGVLRVRVLAVATQVALEVEDHGEGIAPQHLQHLFDTFYSGRPQGVGLGLALVQQIVDAHHGKIEVHSRLGHGSTFRVLLPMA